MAPYAGKVFLCNGYCLTTAYWQRFDSPGPETDCKKTIKRASAGERQPEEGAQQAMDSHQGGSDTAGDFFETRQCPAHHSFSGTRCSGIRTATSRPLTEISVPAETVAVRIVLRPLISSTLARISIGGPSGVGFR
jgi:hypothetical protein